MAFETNFKPAPGTAWKASKEAKAERKAHEREQMQAAKVRDEHKCRVPRCEHMPQKPRIEPCHWREQHRAMGGNPSGDRTQRKLIIALCFIHPRESDRKSGSTVLDIEPQDTAQMFDGPCDYYRNGIHFASKKRIGVSSERGVK
jgi:hypothetical protein